MKETENSQTYYQLHTRQIQALRTYFYNKRIIQGHSTSRQSIHTTQLNNEKSHDTYNNKKYIQNKMDKFNKKKTCIATLLHHTQ